MMNYDKIIRDIGLAASKNGTKAMDDALVDGVNAVMRVIADALNPISPRDVILIYAALRGYADTLKKHQFAEGNVPTDFFDGIYELMQKHQAVTVSVPAWGDKK